MWLRMRKNKEEKWEKYYVNFLDFFAFNLLAGLALGATYAIILAVIYAII